MDLSACIFWGTANNQSDVSIQNLSIHGVSFRSKKYFTEGAQFQLILPRQGKGAEKRKIQAKVVRCETLNGFSSGGKFKVGAQFLFKSHKPKKYEGNLTTETLPSLQSIDPPPTVLCRDNEGLKNYVVRTDEKRTQGPSVFRIKLREVSATLIHSVRTPLKKETVFTSIKIKQARIGLFPAPSSSQLMSSREPLAETGNHPPAANLARQNFPDKRNF